jgi:hypothetical protein
MTRTRKTLASLLAGFTLLGATAMPMAAAKQNADGLVNVQIGDSLIEDVNVAAAVPLVLNACPNINVGPLQVTALSALIGQVDRHGGQKTVCTGTAGPVTISQN